MVSTIISEPSRLSFFFFNDTATTEIYTLSLHDALPISRSREGRYSGFGPQRPKCVAVRPMSLCDGICEIGRAHVELQSQSNLVCRLLLEKKKNTQTSVCAAHAGTHDHHLSPSRRRRVRA